jgi:hypothetical protein
LNAAQSQVAQCWHILSDILSSSTVSSCAVVFLYSFLSLL